MYGSILKQTERLALHLDKSVIDYEQAREVKDLVRFATSRMPNYVERVKSADDLAAVQAKREEWGLPMVLDRSLGREWQALRLPSLCPWAVTRRPL